jgi:hypothetical protein
MYEGRNKECTREATLPEPVLMTPSGREFANVLWWYPVTEPLACSAGVQRMK